ncbi:GNAT family N-acetyltransferase [Exiguobacterium oxidotolerans]|uniref:GNAT family N-acetyltransferase n=1 Tax=Exiguobacterium oxidotolerans TaxID=223958 RepID=UPI0004944DF8|nr:GNAT family N-acetyltransferase [Exiguobacterium oxidotolerans]
MNVQLSSCTVKDTEALYAFEIDNRLFFEQSIPSRGDAYYLPETFKERHAALLQEQQDGSSFFYLIKDEAGTILGRINLVDRNQIEKTAQLGYRIGQVHAGKGIAKEAVRLLLGQCREYDIDEVEAKTTDANIASQKILTHNGFKRVDKKEEVAFNGQRIQLMHYSWRR